MGSVGPKNTQRAVKVKCTLDTKDLTTKVICLIGNYTNHSPYFEVMRHRYSAANFNYFS